MSNKRDIIYICYLSLGTILYLASFILFALMSADELGSSFPYYAIFIPWILSCVIMCCSTIVRFNDPPQFCPNWLGDRKNEYQSIP